MIKYNEIMSSATIDPAMKRRVMDAVSKAIKENPQAAAPVDDSNDSDEGDSAVVTNLKDKSEVTGSKPYRKKADRSPLAAIISIAAVLVVVCGAVYFVYTYMGGTMKTASPMKNFDTSSGSPAQYVNAVEAANGNYDGAEVEGIDSEGLDGAVKAPIVGGSAAAVVGSGTKNDDFDEGIESDHTTGAVGNERLDRISKKIPFELKGTGTLTETNGVTGEIFLGENGEKVIIRSAPEGTDVLAATYSGSDKLVGVDGTTQRGTNVKLYHVAYGDVLAIAKGETPSDYNAALFTKNGNTYLIVFSAITDIDSIYGVIDVL